MRTGAAISHTPNPRPGIREAMQHNESSVHPVRDTHVGQPSLKG